MKSPLVYPIYPEPISILERLALKLRVSPGYCPVCGRFTIMKNWLSNFRDSGWCIFCHASNRQRQTAHLICNRLGQSNQLPIPIPIFKNHCSLRKIPTGRYVIYNTETTGAIHTQLLQHPDYCFSEYVGKQYFPGQNVNGIRHEDLMNLSFYDESFDLVISSDILEHVPFPYRAHEEIWRVLKPGGIHIFTVPFHQTGYVDDVHVRLEGNNEVYLKKPIYHTDPIRNEDILVYRIFSLEMLMKLQKIGFQIHMYRFHSPFLGIFGANGIVFEAIKLL